MNVEKTLQKWQYILDITHYTINIEPINKAQVTYAKSIPTEDKYFIGVSKTGKNTFTIYHDRPLTEEDILHELLHVAHPQLSESSVNYHTKALLSA